MTSLDWGQFQRGVDAAWHDLQARGPAGMAGLVGPAEGADPWCRTALFLAGYQAVLDLPRSLRWMFVRAVRDAERRMQAASRRAARDTP